MTGARSRAGTVAVVGSVNVDLVATVARFPTPGETVPARSIHVAAGGKGANQAVAAARLGADVHLIARVGEDHWGRWVQAALTEAGVSTTTVRAVSGQATGIALIALAGHDNTIIVSAEANHAWPDLLAHDTGIVADADIVLGQFEVPDEVLVAAAGDAQRRFMLTASPARPIRDSLLRACDPVIVNEHELAQLVDPVSASPAPFDFQDALAAVTGLRRRGARSVVATLGAQGAVYCDEHGTGHVPAPPVTAVDTVGAGDAFAGALAVQLGRGDGLPEAVGVAVAAASCAVQHAGTHSSYPTGEDLAAFRAGHRQVTSSA